MFFSGKNKKVPRQNLGTYIKNAERTGFEPANRFCRLHAFQACLFNHSSTSPKCFAPTRNGFSGCKGTNKRAKYQIFLVILISEHQAVTKLIDNDRLLTIYLVSKNLT